MTKQGKHLWQPADTGGNIDAKKAKEELIS